MRVLEEKHETLLVIEFLTVEELHHWLLANAKKSRGIWIRLYKTKSQVKTVSFQDVLEEGLCFGWSESLRHAYDALSYLQKFGPRQSKGTKSPRNVRLVSQLAEANRMRPEGYIALGLQVP